MRQAVEELGARRVQHGVRAAEDESVLRLLAERGICCDVALTSNVCLKVTPDLSKHPLRRLLDAHDELGLTRAELVQLNLNGLRHGLAEPGARRRLMLEFAAYGGA